MRQYNSVGSGIWIDERVRLGSSISIGHASCIGYESSGYTSATIGDNVRVGAFCVIALGATINNDVEIDHYCRIEPGVTIGEKSKILYGVQLFRNAVVGKDCIVGGDLAERTILEDKVTFMGEIAHSYRNPNLDWDTTDEPSPVIRYGSVVGVNALIIGGVTIGPQAYIGAGEIVRADVPARSVLYRGRISQLEDWRGIIQARE